VCLQQTAAFLAIGIPFSKEFRISTLFLAGDPRSKSHAQKPANLTVSFI
jgi:hypothetical protein